MSSPKNPSLLPDIQGAVCPLPFGHTDQIVIGHGSGGKMTHDLIQSVFMPYFNNEFLAQGNDFALLPTLVDPQKNRLILTTDSHIVSPIFFPGGDIGRLAICGTVNDICVSGGTPLYITAGFIIEEGFPISDLRKVLESMASAAQEAGVQIVAGDTKVVEKGKADKLFITTTGCGLASVDVSIGGQYAQPGDVVILSGSVGDHGIAVLGARGDLGFIADVQSDVAPLNHLTSVILEAAPHTHVLRDPTRGGVATTLNEIARQSQVAIHVDENLIPIHPSVRSACELLGFDPLYIANEGKLIIITPADEAQNALYAIKMNPHGSQAAVIGSVSSAPKGRVLMKTGIGGTRILEMLAGEMLPRIC